MATNGSFGQQEQYKGALEAYPAAPASNSATRTEEESGKLTNDQVGWYFVEQYYTTLSKAPEKLHLFYGKQSQFVYGLEAEVANVSVGRQDIQERIKQLDFQDCKVRVSNVDSQASMSNIVIQVIGETSNKAQEPKKFVQTFVLAQQPSGYFVLNDILRYINDEEEEEVEAETAPADGPVDAPAPVDAEPAQTEASAAPIDVVAVDEKLEKAKDVPEVNGEVEETASAKPDEAPATTETAAADADAAAQAIAEEEVKEAEKPKDPSPTPAAKPVETAPVAPAAPAAPAEPAAPPKPMTWASRAAAAAGPRPVVPLPKTATPPAPAQNRAPAPAAAPAAAPVAALVAAPSATQPTATPAANKENSEWQTAGADSKRQNRPQSVSGAVAEKEGTMGYVKYVTDKVQDSELKTALAAHGELTYFDINRQKNCAFVEYKTTEGYNAAIAASPLTVNGENIVIEPRRPKANAYGGSSYGSGRGGASGRGRGGYDGRTGNNSRGNFGGQGRGRGSAPRGRGGAQTSNA